VASSESRDSKDHDQNEKRLSADGRHRSHAELPDSRAPRPKLGALALLAFLWGYGWVVGKVALAHSAPFTFAALRTVMAALAHSAPFTFAALRTVMAALALFCLLVALRRPLRPPAFRYTALIGLLQTSCFAGFSMWALANSQAGKTSVLIYVMPFALLLLALSAVK
jgi:drug/metabolite transporter (DMT)-like permease